MIAPRRQGRLTPEARKVRARIVRKYIRVRTSRIDPKIPCNRRSQQKDSCNMRARHRSGGKTFQNAAVPGPGLLFDPFDRNPRLGQRRGREEAVVVQEGLFVSPRPALIIGPGAVGRTRDRSKLRQPHLNAAPVNKPNGCHDFGRSLVGQPQEKVRRHLSACEPGQLQRLHGRFEGMVGDLAPGPCLLPRDR